MAKSTKAVAEEKFAALQRKKETELEDQEKAARERKDHMATLKARRLEKEAKEREAAALEKEAKNKKKKTTTRKKT